MTSRSGAGQPAVSFLSLSFLGGSHEVVQHFSCVSSCSRDPGRRSCPASPAGPCSTPPSCPSTSPQALHAVAQPLPTNQVSGDICISVPLIQLCNITVFPVSSVQHIIPTEVFYTDSSMGFSRRIPNILSDLGVSHQQL